MHPCSTGEATGVRLIRALFPRSVSDAEEESGSGAKSLLGRGLQQMTCVSTLSLMLQPLQEQSVYAGLHNRR